MRILFYKGLKEFVKDKLARVDHLDTLDKLAEAAVKIDNRAYKRRIEKKGVFIYYIRPSKNRYGDLMELDATRYREINAFGKVNGKTRNKEVSDKEKKRRREERLYYECGKPSHIARDCKGKQPRI
jgi:hypothetical protein